MQGRRLFEHVHPREQSERESVLARLGALSGFQALSKKQQQFVTLSFYIQARAERGTDVVSAMKIGDVPEQFTSVSPEGTYIKFPDPPSEDTLRAFNEHVGSYSYRKSQGVIESEYCRSVVNELEALTSGGRAPGAWIDAGLINSFGELKELVSIAESQAPFPFVLEIAHEEAGKDTSRGFQHMAILMGADASGYVVWEKAGFHLPFQLVSLEQVYRVYSEVGEHAQFPARLWKIRPLST